MVRFKAKCQSILRPFRKSPNLDNRWLDLDRNFGDLKVVIFGRNKL
jgi:hypothetical protein